VNLYYENLQTFASFSAGLTASTDCCWSVHSPSYSHNKQWHIQPIKYTVCTAMVSSRSTSCQRWIPDAPNSEAGYFM